MTAQLQKALAEVKTMSIVGMCKNAGKTTVLNWLLANAGRERVLGLTSIGGDGYREAQHLCAGGYADRHGQGYAALG